MASDESDGGKPQKPGLFGRLFGVVEVNPTELHLHAFDRGRGVEGKEGVGGGVRGWIQ